jgi:hypothetical protein
MSIWAPSSPVARHGRRPPVAWTWDDGNAKRNIEENGVYSYTGIPHIDG